MNATQRPNVLITGVSTGIGYDAARYLVERGYRVFGSVRNQADGDRVAQALGSNFTPLRFDVTDTEAIASVLDATISMYDVSWWRPITLKNNDGVFAMEISAFKKYFAGFGAAY